MSLWFQSNPYTTCLKVLILTCFMGCVRKLHIQKVTEGIYNVKLKYIFVYRLTLLNYFKYFHVGLSRNPSYPIVESDVTPRC